MKFTMIINSLFSRKANLTSNYMGIPLYADVFVFIYFLDSFITLYCAIVG